jgi:hypothetical protein
MKRAAGRGIKSWELTDELRERVREFIPQRKRDEKRRTDESRGGKKTNTAPAYAGRYPLCAADRHPVESAA